VNALIHEEPLGPKGIPRNEQNDTDCNNRYLPFMHFHITSALKTPHEILRTKQALIS
jgi:hypothetical protein